MPGKHASDHQVRRYMDSRKDGYSQAAAAARHLAAALGTALVDTGRRVLFTRTTDLVQKLQAARRDLTLPATLAKLDRFDCLVLDDLGYVRSRGSCTVLGAPGGEIPLGNSSTASVELSRHVGFTPDSGRMPATQLTAAQRL